MDFGFSEEQEMLRSSARDFLTKEAPMTYVRKMMEDEVGFTGDLWKKMADLGWMGLILPEQYGGSGLDFVDLGGGGRVYLQLTDCDADRVAIGMPLELTFRRLHDGGGFHNYFWKARPA